MLLTELYKRIRPQLSRFYKKMKLDSINRDFRRGKPVLFIGNSEEKIQRILNFLNLSKSRYRTITTERYSELNLSNYSAIVRLEEFGKRRKRISFRQFDCDDANNRNSAWELCDLHSALLPAPPLSSRQYKYALTQILEQKRNIAYIFGTGPSLSDAIKFDWSGGYRIVCNTIVKDPETWQHIKPDAIVAADALYHFSDSKHAQAFRKDLESRLDDYPCFFFFPERFYSTVYNALPRHRNLLCPVPPGIHTKPHLSMLKTRGGPVGTGNILNLLLLPIACTLSKNVGLIGFDGRAPKDSGFWSNSSKHSYPDLIEDLKITHPPFFNFHVPKEDITKYVRKVHGDALDNRLIQAEAEGWSFKLLAKSYTEVLQKRLDLSALPPETSALSDATE